MKYLKQFNIPISGLEIGTHQYDFLIDGKFFEAFEESEINKCRVELRMELVRQTELIVLRFVMNGMIELFCDRCLDPYDFFFDTEESVVLKFKGRADTKETGEDEYILPEQEEIDIRQYIYDFIILQIPYRKVHPEDEYGNSMCDKEVLRKIEELSVKKETDSRWDQLKDIQNN